MISIEKIDIYILPIIISVYHGMSKSNIANDFFIDFVNDFLFILKNGITVSDKKYTVSIVCDISAKSFILILKVILDISLVWNVHKKVILYIIEWFFQKLIRLYVQIIRSNIDLKLNMGNSILEKLSIGIISQIPLAVLAGI